MTFALNELCFNSPDWLNLSTAVTNKSGYDIIHYNLTRFSRHFKPINVYNPADFQAFNVVVQKKKKEFILLLVDFIKLFFGGKLLEIAGITLSLDEAMAETDELTDWISARRQDNHPSGIVLTIDPFERYAVNENPDYVAEKILLSYEQFFAKSSMNIPLAVVITKSDRSNLSSAWGGDFCVTASQLKQLRRLESYKSVSDTQLVNALIEYRSKNIRVYLRKYRPNLINLLDNAFSPVCYFASNCFAPFTTLYPLLWLIGQSLEY